jgi:hypothetical protein
MIKGGGMPTAKKRGPNLFLSIAMAMALVSCEPQAVLFPLYTEKDLVTDDNLVGTWADGEGGIYTFEQSAEHKALYLVSFEVEHVKMLSDVHLLRLGDYLFIDLTANYDRFPEEAKAKGLRVPYPLASVHNFGRIRIDPAGAYISMALLDNDWVRRQQEEHTLGLDVLWPEDYEGILVSPTLKLQEFARQHAEDKSAFSFKVTLCRQGLECQNVGPI